MSTEQSKFERRLLRGLVRILDNESGQLRRFKIIYWALAIFGGLLIGAGLWPVAATGSPIFWAVIGAGVGGFVAGFGNFYYVAYRQWPFLKRYLDAKAIRDDCQKSEA
jgi:hypothetical protein